ncbi:MAG: maltose alpha-D-glucosyltransferase [Thermomicrobiales bacterium]
MSTTTAHARPLGESLWYKDAIIYETHVRAFFDSDADGVGDFRGLIEKLDYLHDLGITAIWLLPFYPSPLKDDGYDIADYFTVHPAYGTLNDFKGFLREAHRRGIRVITELVVNHTSDQHPWFQRSRRAPRGSAERDFYVWSDTPEKYQDARIIFKDFEQSNWTWDPIAGAYFWHRFYSHQPDLNYDNPAVRNAVFEVVDFWLEMGVDGLRLDAVPYLIERDDTDCENLPETHEVLKELRRYMDDRYADRMLLAEANQWPEESVAYFGAGDECHMAFHFPVMPRLFMAIQTEDHFPIVDILDQTPQIPESTQWALFLRNHDELTLEMVTDEERLYMYRVYAQAPEARINLGIRRRLAPLLGNSRRRIELMNALLFSLPGTPVIYYGDEIGMGDNIYLGDRNGVRTPMQWSDDRHAGFSRAHPQRLYLPLITDHEYHYETIHVEAQEENRHSLLWWMRGLIARRKRHKAFGRGTLEFVNPTNRKVIAFVRRYENEQILVVANLSRFVQPFELDLSEFRGLVPIEMIGRAEFWPIDDRPYQFMLGPHAFSWFSLEPARVELSTQVVAGSELPAPVLVTRGAWDDVVHGEARGDLEDLLPDYLREQRWFTGTGRQILSTRIADAIPVPYGETRGYLAIVRVAYTEGDPELYALPLAFTPDRPGHSWQGPQAAMIAHLRETQDNRAVEGILHDALWDGQFAAALLQAIEHGRHLHSNSGTVVPMRFPGFHVGHAQEAILQSETAAEDQNNTSIRFGDQLILKFFRRLDDGVNPELEVGRFLSEQGFIPVAPIAGALQYERSRTEGLTLAVLHSFVAHDRSAWEAALADLDRYFERAMVSSISAPRVPLPSAKTLLDLADEGPPAQAREWIGPALDSAALLGRRTAELHQALASPTGDQGFLPVSFTPFSQRSLYQSMRGLTGRVVSSLHRDLPGLPGPARANAQRVIELEESILQRFHAVLEHRLDANMIRCHGDLHLDEVLIVDGDVVFIDFEGDPQFTVGERQLKRSPLRDVAAMLRSFQYAASTAFSRHAETAGDKQRTQLAPWARFWEFWTGISFLRAYLHHADGALFLPADREHVAILLDTYLLERALLELAYELRTHPNSSSIPVDGILRLLEAETEVAQPI